MTDYTITTNFGAKDSLPSGNAGKVIKGEEFTTEFTNIQTAVNTKADTAGDTFTGAVNFSADVAVNTNTLFVDVSENRVGIGTTSPSFKTDINVNSTSANDTQVALRVKSTTTADMTNDFGVSQLFSVEDSSGTNFNIAQLRVVRDGADDSGAFAFSPYSTGTATERMRIDASGNVGIGTDNPQRKLHVQDGDILIESTFPRLYLTDTDNNSDYSIINSQGAFSIYDDTNGLYRMQIEASGKVGIGTTTPASEVDIFKASGGDSALSLTSQGVQRHQIIQKGHLDGGLVFYNHTASAERMRIDTSGNVGIGTASPAARLDVKNNTALGSTNGDWLLLSRIQSHTGNQTDLEIGNLRDSAGSTWQQAGTRIQSKIDSTYMGYMQFNGTGNEHGISFGVGASTASHGSIPERMRIDSSGNLLVGTTVANPAGSNSVGVGISSGSYGGFIGVTRDGNTPVEINRKTSDGNLITFRKDGTAVGSIGTVLVSNTRYFYIGSTANNVNTGIGFWDQGIYASNSTGAFSSGNKDLGSSTVRWRTAYLTQQPNVSSDQRLKQNIEDADDAGSTIDAIQVRKFDWIEDGRHQKYGMIAQELAEVYPEAVNVPENEEDTLGIATGDLIPMLIKEVQSLRSRVAELENK